MRRLLGFVLGSVLLVSTACKDKPKQRSNDDDDDRGGSGSSGPSPQTICTKLMELVEQEDNEKKKQKDDAKQKKQMDECVKELGEIRDVSPKGYECISKCTKYKTSGAVFGCFLECEEKDDKLKEHNKKKQERGSDDRAKKILEWPKLSPKSFDGTVTDLDKPVRYTITLAEGFVEKPIGQSLNTYELEDKENFTSTHVSVMPWLAEDLDKAVEEAKVLKKTAVKKQKTEGGYVLQFVGDTGLEADVLVKSGTTFIKCSASVYTVKVAELQAELLPWLEKLCTSVQIK